MLNSYGGNHRLSAFWTNSLSLVIGYPAEATLLRLSFFWFISIDSYRVKAYWGKDFFLEGIFSFLLKENHLSKKNTICLRFHQKAHDKNKETL